MADANPSRPTAGVGRQRLLGAAAAIAAAVCGFAVTAGVAPTEATWVATRTLNVSAGAVTPIPPTGLACTAGGVFGNVTFTWTATAGIPPSGYTLKWTGGSVTSTTTTAVVPEPFLGSRTVRVYTDYGTSWQSAAGTQTRTITSVLGAWSCG